LRTGSKEGLFFNKIEKRREGKRKEKEKKTSNSL